MKSQERRTLRRKKGGRFSHGQEVRVWENRRRERKMVIINMVSVHIPHCCSPVSSVDMTNHIILSLLLSTSLGVTEGKETVKSEGHSVTRSCIETGVKIEV